MTARLLPDPEATAALGRALAGQLRPGDIVCLWGGLGAGKTALARALIREAQSLAGIEPDEVPSPTFTLLQTYDTGMADIWHYDLYRIEDPAEMDELGWDEACTDGIVLVEWPERLGHLLPADRLDIRLAVSGTGRMVELVPQGRFHEITP